MFAVEEVVSNPVIQYGFAGFSMVLVAFLYWLVRVQITNGKTDRTIAERCAEVIEGNTRALDKLADKLEARPCLAKRKQQS